MLDLCHDSCCLKHIQEPGTLVFSFTSLLQSPQSKFVKRCLLSAHFRITLGALCIQRAQTPSPTDPLPSGGAGQRAGSVVGRGIVSCLPSPSAYTVGSKFCCASVRFQAGTGQREQQVAEGTEEQG